MAESAYEKQLWAEVIGGRMSYDEFERRTRRFPGQQRDLADRVVARERKGHPHHESASDRQDRRRRFGSFGEPSSLTNERRIELYGPRPIPPPPQRDQTLEGTVAAINVDLAAESVHGHRIFSHVTVEEPKEIRAGALWKFIVVLNQDAVSDLGFERSRINLNRHAAYEEAAEETAKRIVKSHTPTNIPGINRYDVELKQG